MHRAGRVKPSRRLLGVALVMAGAGVIAGRSLMAAAAATTARSPRAEAAPPGLPLRFEANRGQLDARVRFLARGPGYALFLTRTGATLTLERAGAAAHVVSMRVVGGREVEPTAMGRLPGTTSYLLGDDRSRWHTGIAGHAGVRYDGVRPGVDLVYYGNGQRQLEYDLVLAPGADPGALALAFEGVERIDIDPRGHALMALGGGATLRQAPPFAYQQDAGGGRTPIAARYRLRGDGVLGFEVGAHDRTRPLIIDPVLRYSTYLGGSNSDGATAAAVDAAGNLYVAGYTLSANFPTASPLQAASAGSYDVFVSKLDPGGTSLVYSTYLGGSGEDRVTGLAVDAAGNVYLTGHTLSTNFPTASPLRPANAGAQDAFVAKLNAAGAALVYATYLGGSSTDAAYGIGVDSTGSAHVAGYTFSTNFPTAAPLKASLSGTTDAFVARLNPAGSALLHATYLGGSGDEVANGIAVDGAGNASVAGWTTSANFPTHAAVQSALGGASDAFVSRLNASGSTLTSSTYLGGSGQDVAQAVAVDPDGHAHVAGYTNSTDFPTASPLQGTFGGTYDGFVSKLGPGGSSLVYSTYLGGSFLDRINAISVAPNGRTAVAGYAESRDFPLVLPALQPEHGGGLGDAFVSAFNPSGSALVLSTYLGGISEDNGHAVAASANDIHVAGVTRSANFPVHEPIQGTLAAGPFDAFVTKIVMEAVRIPSARPATTAALAGLLLGLVLLLAPRRRATPRPGEPPATATTPARP